MATYATTSDSTWSYWTTGTTSNTAVSATVIWATWNADASTYYYRTAEQTRRQIAAARRAAEKQAAAEERARVLLLSHLDAVQRAEYEREQSFRVIVGERTYRIHRGWAGNVQLIDDDGGVEQLCIHPRHSVPHEDNMLAQKLMLESNEEEFRKIANITRLRAA